MINKVLNKIKQMNQPAVQTLDDEYLAWLGFANAGMLNPGNPFCMEEAIKNIASDNPIVEIGSFCGLSTNVISYLLQKHGKSNKIITSDRWIFEGAENGGNLGGSKLEHKEYREYVMESFKRNINFFSKDNVPYPIEVFSDEFFEKWGKEEHTKDIFDREIKLGGPISFAYVDGNHTYEFSKRDFTNIDRHLEIGGYILFDDSSDFSQFGCALLMKELKKDLRYKLIHKNPNYLFQKIGE